MSDNNNANHRVDGRTIMAFVESVQHVFGMMLQCDVRTDQPRIERSDTRGHDVSAIIAFSGDMTGSIVLSFPVDTASRVATLLTGAEQTPDSPDFADALGEMANMVAGNAKSRFTDARVDIACPSVIIGPNHQVFSGRDLPRIDLPCDCDCGPFVIMVSLRPTKQPRTETSRTNGRGNALGVQS